MLLSKQELVFFGVIWRKSERRIHNSTLIYPRLSKTDASDLLWISPVHALLS
jgi:hypothetical protein